MTDNFTLRAPTKLVAGWVDDIKAFYCVGDLSMSVRSSCFARAMRYLRAGQPRLAKLEILKLISDYAETRSLHDWNCYVAPKYRGAKK